MIKGGYQRDSFSSLPTNVKQAIKESLPGIDVSANMIAPLIATLFERPIKESCPVPWQFAQVRRSRNDLGGKCNDALSAKILLLKRLRWEPTREKGRSVKTEDYDGWCVSSGQDG